MEKQKSKRQPGLLREILTGIAWGVGLFCVIGLVGIAGLVICGLVFLQAITDEPLFYFSKDIPYEQRYHLTGNSYVAGWMHWDTDRVEVPRSRAIRRDEYQKAFTDDITLKTQIDFVYYDSVDYVRKHHTPHVGLYGDVVDYEYVRVSTLKADRFDVGCTHISKTETLPFILERYSCDFAGIYGSCIIVVSADVLEPFVSSNDYKQLIEDYIDPQMAEWDVCYPDRQTASIPYNLYG